MSGPHPAVARARLAVREALGTLAPGSLVLVGCSGGSDSLALAAATAFVAPRLGLRAGAVVVDHNLSPTSPEIADRAAGQCEALGLDPVLIERVTVRPGGLESEARTARHAAFDRARQATGAAAVMLGHTMDDQAETVLLGLARGWEDPGNRVDGPHTSADGGALPRSAVRHRVLPALADALHSDPVPALARTAELLRRDTDLLDQLALVEAEHAATPTGLRVEILGATHPALLGRVLRRWLIAAGAPAGALGAVHLEATGELITAWRGQRGVVVPGSLVVRRIDGELRVGPITGPTGGPDPGGCGTLQG